MRDISQNLSHFGRHSDKSSDHSFPRIDSEAVFVLAFVSLLCFRVFQGRANGAVR